MQSDSDDGDGGVSMEHTLSTNPSDVHDLHESHDLYESHDLRETKDLRTGHKRTDPPPIFRMKTAEDTNDLRTHTTKRRRHSERPRSFREPNWIHAEKILLVRVRFELERAFQEMMIRDAWVHVANVFNERTTFFKRFRRSGVSCMRQFATCLRTSRRISQEIERGIDKATMPQQDLEIHTLFHVRGCGEEHYALTSVGGLASDGKGLDLSDDNPDCQSSHSHSDSRVSGKDNRLDETVHELVEEHENATVIHQSKGKETIHNTTRSRSPCASKRKLDADSGSEDSITNTSIGRRFMLDIVKDKREIYRYRVLQEREKLAILQIQRRFEEAQLHSLHDTIRELRSLVTDVTEKTKLDSHLPLNPPQP
eukprot:TRINITY_DN11163_c0_g1_i1.p1 TRINITY_DN11163_c0_g1~~TRINITY_DN11163_c0_g1_i1.p1  ORF type:complete len:367 (+),score=64.96 TRINITY_DN11163_c0_g1_i1:48-1148(+)